MENCEIEVNEEGEFPIFLISGYFTHEACDELRERSIEIFQKGKNKIILDVAGCRVINSPGVTAIMDVTLQLTEDFEGKMVVIGLNPLKESVFKMVGVVPTAQMARSLDEAIKILRGK